MDRMVADTQQLDNTIEIVTPENIAFRYQVAGPFRRVMAYLIDLLIRGFLLVVTGLLAAVVFGLAGLLGLGGGLWLVFWFLVEWFYFGLFETFWNGQTPGKRLLHIRVLSVDGQPINGLQAVLRNLLRTVDEQPFRCCLVGLLAAAMNDRFQRLGDLVSGTMVVVEERRWSGEVMRLRHPEVVRMAGQVPAGFQPTRTLSLALAAYVHRRMYFPEPRRLEIARYLGEPLREKFGLPADTNPDLLLCGVYQRTFFTDWDEPNGVRAGSPFGAGESPFARPGADSPQPAEVAAVGQEGGQE